MIGVAVIGCGYWGPNVLRNLSVLEGCTLRAMCDHDPARLAPLQRLYPGVRTLTDPRAVFDAPDVDAVAICTPIETHHPLGRAALLAGKHVMIEKPLTHSVETAEDLIALAEAKGLTLQVDHTFVYSGAVQKIRAMLDGGNVGDLLYVDSVRINLGLFQSDVGVVWDLAPHDVSILTYLVDVPPIWVSAIGSTHYGTVENQAYVTIKYPGSLIAHIHVNWLAPVKLRSTLIGGSKRMIVYDDLAPTEKIRIYEKGVTLHGGAGARERALVDYRVGDMLAPYVDKTEPLARVCRSFVDAISRKTRPLTDGRAGLAVVRILEAAQRSLGREGERVELVRPELRSAG